MEELTIEETMDWAQDPMRTCGDAPVILQSRFNQLAIELTVFTDQVSLNSEQIIEVLEEQMKRFSGCGGNFADKTGMIRRNPGHSNDSNVKNPNSNYGWQYILDLIK